MTTTVLKATDLCKTFSNESVQQHVLKNLNLEIRKGDFTVIMGDSGAGKSTLLYSLSGMDRPSLGAILYGSEEINDTATTSSHCSEESTAVLFSSRTTLTTP